ncbi:hypothetical protein MTP03_13930 [Tsukamurella sp. PLM1]|nr:hypothetical protein MTP03_13930 [Tsukamurella sp. PLM1]
MTFAPAARPARTRGVSGGIATTSNTVSAASISGAPNARSSAAGPPAMPTGVALTRTRVPSGGVDACRKPYWPASAAPVAALRATTVTSVQPWSRSAATTALAIPPAPVTAAGSAGSTEFAVSSEATAA